MRYTRDSAPWAEAADPAVEMGVELAGTARLTRLHEMPANDAMRADAPHTPAHFAAPTSALLFAPRTRGGLGITGPDGK